MALALRAIERGYGAYFVRAYDLMEDLRKARAERNLDRRMRVYLAPKVLIVDEIGIWPYDRESATAFFTLVSARYERGSIILTSNKGFAEWGELLGDTVIASAILDRLLHHSHMLNIRDESYRLKDKRNAGVFTSHQLLAASPEGINDNRPGRPSDTRKGETYLQVLRWVNYESLQVGQKQPVIDSGRGLFSSRPIQNLKACSLCSTVIARPCQAQRTESQLAIPLMAICTGGPANPESCSPRSISSTVGPP